MAQDMAALIDINTKEICDYTIIMILINVLYILSVMSCSLKAE